MNLPRSIKRFRLAHLAVRRCSSSRPINFRKLYAVKARHTRALRELRLAMARNANANNLPVCGYCGYPGHTDTPCLSRAVDCGRFTCDAVARALRNRDHQSRYIPNP